MEITKTVKVKITSHRKIFDETLIVYRNALGFIIDVVNKEWLALNQLRNKERNNYIEKAIHKTKYNLNPKYANFDTLFYKFPSYLRRSAIAEAIGIVSSYNSNYQNWLDKKQEYKNMGKEFREQPPVLQSNTKSFPVFYKSNMFQRLDENTAMIKIFYKGDWVWITITFDKKNLLNRDLEQFKELNPKLVKSGKKYELHIPFQKSVQFNHTPLENKVIIAVDLGLTNSAVCSALKADGTIIGRIFINQPIEKDRLFKMLGKLSKAKKQSGNTRKPNYWRRINGLQKFIIQDTANKIVEFAQKHNGDVIVFEYLGKMKVPKNFYGAKRLRYKLQFWAKNKIQDKVAEKAHASGIRISRVSARNTSKLAFDGSGEVMRNTKGDICVFPNGKIYHADLSASYNIGSRYFIREYLKTLSETTRLQVEAKVPSLAKRTTCTLASLINLNKALPSS